MAGFSSIDDFVSEVSTNGKFWRQDFNKLLNTGTVVAGNAYDLWLGNGIPAQDLHGNLVSNYDTTSSQLPWQGVTGTWSYTPATHLLTKTASASNPSIYQTLRLAAGCTYYVRYTLTRSAGSITAYLGGTADPGGARSSAATFSSLIICGTSDKNITFTADATFAGTVDLVSVQPINTFVPYNDQREGALYHGGDVGTDRKSLVNFGAWVNAASVPNVLYLVDVLGCYPRAVATATANTVIPLGTNSVRGSLIYDCQLAGGFNEQVVSNVTQSTVVKATEGVTGASQNASCSKIAVGASFTTGIIASKVVTVVANTYNYQYAKYVYLWLRSDTTTLAGDITFCTDENTSLASSQDVNCPVLTQNVWQRVRLDVTGVATTDRDAVISIGFKCTRDFGAFNLYVDDIEWAGYDYVLTNGNFAGASTGWTLGTGWAYSSNDIAHTAGNVLAAYQDLCPLVQKCPYYVTYTITGRSAGTVTASVGGTSGAANSTSGTYSEIITCGTTNWMFALTPSNDFDGHINNVICEALMPRSDAGSANFGAGNKMYYVWDNQVTNGAQTANMDIRYTNSSAAEGTHNRALGGTVTNMSGDVVAHIPHSGVGAGKYGPFLPLAGGDCGIQSVESISFSGAAATAESAVNVIVCKMIASIPITTAQVVCERDLMNQLPSLPRIRDGACLQLVHMAGMVTVQGTAFMGYLDFAWG